MTDRGLSALVNPDSEFGGAARGEMTGGVSDPIEQLLSNLPLTDDLIELLGPPLEELRFPVKMVQDYGRNYRSLDFHCVQVSGDQRIALIHVAEKIFEISRYVTDAAGHIEYLFEKLCQGLFIFFEEEKPDTYYRLEEAWKRSFPLGAGIFGKVRLKQWRGLKKENPEEFKRSIGDTLNLDKLPRGVTSGDLSHDDEKAIVQILVKLSDGYDNLEDFLERIAQEARVSSDLKRDIRRVRSEDPKVNAGKLIRWALSMGPNPEDPPNSVLGTVLVGLKSFFGPDLDDQAILDRVIDQQRKLTWGT